MRFIESILFQNDTYINIALHQQRMNRVFEFYQIDAIPHDLSKILPPLTLQGTYKVRLVYDMDDEDATYDIQVSPYTPRKIQTLQVVHSEPFDYSMKYENRETINTLCTTSTSDDIIIAIQDKITDGSYFNLAFWDGKTWHTPNTPLLQGVRRTQLLNEGKIVETSIRVSDIASFKKVSLINAMIDLGELEVLTSDISVKSS